MLDSTPAAPRRNARAFPRLQLPAMYTLVRVRTPDDSRYRWTGYIYDISEGGMRLEIDDELPAGTTVCLRAMLPGSEQTVFRATGTIVRIHDNEPGPVRMAVAFTEFASPSDRLALQSYLNDQMAQRAAAEARDGMLHAA